MGVGVGDVGECGHAARRMLQPRAPILASASARSFIACPLWARTCLILTTSPRLRKRASTALFASTILLFDLGFHAPVVVWMARKESARMCNSCPLPIVSGQHAYGLLVPALPLGLSWRAACLVAALVRVAYE